MRSTFYCLSCKTGFNKFEEVKAITLHGIKHQDPQIAEIGYWAVAFHCLTCDAPVYTDLRHLVAEQRLAFRRWNAKRKKRNGKSKKI